MIRPYASYRDSGVEWIGQVPEHWEVQRIEHVAEYHTSTVDKKTEDGELPIRLCNYIDVYYRERIRSDDGEFMEATASPREVARFKLHIGDILVTKDSEDWRDIAVPALVEETADDFVCGYHLGIIRPGPMAHTRFLFRTMQSVSVNERLQTYASGVTRYGLPNAAVGDTTIAVPPLPEQHAIAAFLDRETERTDALVAKQQLLIERLEEYRTALITRTVTRGLPPEAARAAGLDPSPRLKPSGVAWLGDVPEHWEVQRLKFLASTNDEALTDKEDALRPVSYVDIGSVNANGQITQMEEVVFEDAPSRARRLIRDGDTILSTVRTYLRAIAPVCSPPADMVVSTGFAVIRPRNVDSGFTSWALREHGFVEEIVACSTGVSYPAINASRIGELPIPVPPLPEQHAIAAFLDRETERTDALVAKQQLLIERLREHRIALITAAITGKIDVRESARA